MAVMDGPLEPLQTTTTNVPDDPAFVNFFSVFLRLFSLQLEIFECFTSLYGIHLHSL